MKKTIITIITIAASTTFFSSCNNASELPPLNEGYAKEFIMPDPVDLTDEDRASIEAMEKEYKEAIAAN